MVAMVTKNAPNLRKAYFSGFTYIGSSLYGDFLGGESLSIMVPTAAQFSSCTYIGSLFSEFSSFTYIGSSLA